MKNFRKKTISFLLIAILSLACCSCAVNNNDNDGGSTNLSPSEPANTLETIQASSTVQPTATVNPAETITDNGTSSAAYIKPDFEITMEPGFSELDLTGATYFYLKDNTALIIIKEEFKTLEEATELNESSTLLEYGEILKANNEASGISTGDIIVSDNGITYFTYENTSLGQDYFYITAIFKGSDAFWSCTFYCPLENKTQFENVFLDWAATIKAA